MTDAAPLRTARERRRSPLHGFAGRATAPALLVGVLSLTAGGVPPAAAAGALPATSDRVVRGVLLPVPATGRGERVTVTAVDVTPSGVVVGTTRVTTTGPDGTSSTVDVPRRWARIPVVGWVGRRLALPDGATSGTAVGLTDRGEAAGAVTVDGVSRAARWSSDGRSVTLVGGSRSRVGAVGPNGVWGVTTDGVDPLPLTGEAELVTRQGVRTPLRGTPELDAGYRRTVSSIGGPGNALVWVVNGIGRGSTAAPVLWHDGATARLPVFSSVFLGTACVSRMLADGSVVASGFSNDAGKVSFVMVRHVGGVAGTDIVLSRTAAPGEPTAGITCGPEKPSHNLAPDGGIAGFVSDASGRRAAYWNAAGERTVIPLAAGEVSATGVLAAGGGRMVVQSEDADGVIRLSLWRDGVRTRLSIPHGYMVASVVELTESGLLVANVRDAAGAERPLAWMS